MKRAATIWLLMCGAAWAGAFTDPMTTHAQDIRLMQEFTNAWAERAAAIGDSITVGAVTTNDTFQDVAMGTYKPWQAMQQWIMDNCDEFVRHSLPTNSPGEYDGLTNAIVQYGSITDVFADAALVDATITNRGFRRARVWLPPAQPQWLPEGVAQTGDIAQVWVWQDIQTAFSMLKWTKKSTTDWTSAFLIPETAKGPYASDSGARNAVVAAWPGQWTNASSAVVGAVYAEGWGYVLQSGPDWYAGAKRYRALPYVTGVATGLMSTTDVYYMPEGFGAGTTWNDFDGLGVVPNEWHLEETLAATNTSTRTAQTYLVSTNLVSCPLTYVATNSPPDDQNTIGYWVGKATLVLKWDFTYDEVP